jgi:hypothetical protein
VRHLAAQPLPGIVTLRSPLGPGVKVRLPIVTVKAALSLAAKAGAAKPAASSADAAAGAPRRGLERETALTWLMRILQQKNRARKRIPQRA